MAHTQNNTNTAKPPLQVKSFIFPIENVAVGDADSIINEFCRHHDAMSIVLDRYNGNLIYRIIFR